MKTWTSKMLAVSLAGHDKGTLYLVISEEPDATRGTGGDSVSPVPGQVEYLLLTDGKRRTLDHPKRKKARHTQVITHLPEAISTQMREFTLDAHVRKILKEYKAYQEAQETVRE